MRFWKTVPTEIDKTIFITAFKDVQWYFVASSGIGVCGTFSSLTHKSRRRDDELTHKWCLKRQPLRYVGPSVVSRLSLVHLLFITYTSVRILLLIIIFFVYNFFPLKRNQVIAIGPPRTQPVMTFQPLATRTKFFQPQSRPASITEINAGHDLCSASLWQSPDVALCCVIVVFKKINCNRILSFPMIRLSREIDFTPAT